MEAPKCRLCGKHHWAREGCNGMLLKRDSLGGERPAKPAAKAEKAFSAGGKGVRAPIKPPKKKKQTGKPK